MRWLTLTDGTGKGIRIEGLQPIAFTAINHSTEDLDPGLTKKQQHPTDLPPRNHVYLMIDLKQRGVGGDNSWGRSLAPPLDSIEPLGTGQLISCGAMV